MNDQQLEEIIQNGLRDYYDMIAELHSDMDMSDEEIAEIVAESVGLNSPAREEEILACEEFIGRHFSPSYRHFLSLHNGWRGFFNGEGWLFGTQDYLSNDFWISHTIYSSLYAVACNEDWFVKWPQGKSTIPDIYRLERFYRIVDGTIPLSSEEAALKNFLDAYDQKGNNVILPNHTIIGGGPHNAVFLDINTLRPDGEMNAVYAIYNEPKSYLTFYDLLKKLNGVPEAV